MLKLGFCFSNEFSDLETTQPFFRLANGNTFISFCSLNHVIIYLFCQLSMSCMLKKRNEFDMSSVCRQCKHPKIKITLLFNKSKIKKIDFDPTSAFLFDHKYILKLFRGKNVAWDVLMISVTACSAVRMATKVVRRGTKCQKSNLWNHCYNKISFRINELVVVMILNLQFAF